MHPLFVVILIACAGWFFACAAMAKRGLGAQFGFALLGVVEFFVVFGVLEQIMKNQDFFLRALRAGADMGPILTYIVLPTVVVMFFSGLWLKKLLTRPERPKGEQ